MNASEEHVWGLRPQDKSVMWWGARAIYRDGFIDLLWDRQTMANGTDEQRANLVMFIS